MNDREMLEMDYVGERGQNGETRKQKNEDKSDPADEILEHRMLEDLSSSLDPDSFWMTLLELNGNRPKAKWNKNSGYREREKNLTY
jgi:hypothetical protein